MSAMLEAREENLRLPPQRIDAEQAVIGGLMRWPDSLVKISDWLEEGDFYRRDHRLVYRAISALSEQGKPCDIVTMGEWFEANALADQIGGTGYLLELANTTPSAANIVAWAEIVVEMSRKRQAIELGTELVNAGFDRGTTSVDLQAMAQVGLANLAPVQHTGLLPIVPVMRDLYAEMVQRYNAKTLPGLPTPWADLNAVTHGLQDGEVLLVAARSNMGKSVVGFQLSRFTGLRGDHVLRFSLEMTARQAMRRDIAALGEVPYDWMIQPTDEVDHWPAVNKAINLLKRAAMQIDDTARLSAPQICARARRAHLQRPVRLVLIDHLHEVRLPGKQNETIERADALRDFKALAKDLNCPVVVLAQLNRESAKEGRRPGLHDLRGSGGIEEVADVVLFLHRPDYYRPKDRVGAIEVIVGKGREVRTGQVVYLRNRFDQMRADEWNGEFPVELEDKLPMPAATPRGFDEGVPMSGRDRAAGMDR